MVRPSCLCGGIEFEVESVRFMLNCHCSRCRKAQGTPFSRFTFVNHPVGLIDGDPGVRPALHIAVASKARWSEIQDDLPQFEEGVPDIDAVEPT